MQISIKSIQSYCQGGETLIVVAKYVAQHSDLYETNLKLIVPSQLIKWKKQIA